MSDPDLRVVSGFEGPDVAPVASKAAQLRRLELMVTRPARRPAARRVRRRAVGSRLGHRGRACLRRGRRRAPHRLEPHCSVARAAGAHDRSRPRAAHLGDRRPLAEHATSVPRSARSATSRSRPRPRSASSRPATATASGSSSPAATGSRGSVPPRRVPPSSLRCRSCTTRVRRDDVPADGVNVADALVALERTRPRRGQIVVISDFLDAGRLGDARSAASRSITTSSRCRRSTSASSRCPRSGWRRSSTPRPVAACTCRRIRPGSAAGTRPRRASARKRSPARSAPPAPSTSCSTPTVTG